MLEAIDIASWLGADLIIVVGVILVVAAFLGIGIAAWMLFNPTRTAADRVREFTVGDLEASESLFRGSGGKTGSGVMGGIARLATPSDEERLEADRKRMVQAGIRVSNALEIYNAARVVFTLGFPLVGWLVLPEMQPSYLALCIMVFATGGYYLPSKYVDLRLNARRESLLRPFPDALDLLVSSTEAGLGLDAAFMRVADELSGAAPELSWELQAVNHEIAAGISRQEALHRLDERTGLQEINSLVNVLVQAERFGTSVAQALRVHSNMVRTQRMQAAEEQAARISPKMTIVMIVFLLPALFVVILGPAVVNVVQQLLPTLGGVV